MRRFRIALVAPFAFIGVVVPTSVASAEPPLNDAFLDAEMITLDFTDVVDTTDATADDPEDAAGFECGAPAVDASIWYHLTIDSTQWVIMSTSLDSYSTGANAFVYAGDDLQCVAGGAGGAFFIAEPGEYFIQVIDDQWDGGGNGGIVEVSFVSGGAPEPEICPGLIPNNPQIPPGLNRIFGTEGHDVLKGTPGDDLIIGLGGNDLIKGRGGNDVIFGCDGHDRIRGGAGDDFIIGDSADFFGDPTSESGGNDDIRAGKGNDEVRGGPGDDHIHGGAGDDGLFGNQGHDDMDGNSGDDFMGGGFGNDWVRGGGGDDFVSGGFGDDELRGGGGDDFITGDLPNGEEDPEPNHDHCKGGRGMNEIVFCEDDVKH